MLPSGSDEPNIDSPWRAGKILLGRTQTRGARTIDAAVRPHDDAVVALGRLARDQPVRDIERDLVGIALVEPRQQVLELIRNGMRA